MEFPDYGLVKLSPRDLTGPGIEFWARRVSLSAASASLGTTVDANQLSSERLYCVTWAVQLIPGASQAAVSARWFLEYGAADILLFNDNFRTSFGLPVDLPRHLNSPFFVIPGGKTWSFIAEFNAGVNVNVLDGYVWGYSFPKGNVLSW